MKKIISIFLAMMLLVSSMSVFAENQITEDVTEEANPLPTLSDEEINNANISKKLLDAAGITTSFSALLNERVTRAQFIEAVMSAFRFSKFESDELCFYDVSKNDSFAWALSYALDFGIISQGTHFRPNDPITYYEACKIMTVALGYEPECARKGGWPFGYLYVADELDILLNTDIHSNEPLTVATSYQMIRNMAEADMRMIDSIAVKNPDYVVSYEGNKNLLERFYKWNRIDDIVYANDRTHMNSSSAYESDGFIKVGDSSYLCNENILIGSHIEGYWQEIEGQKVIKFFEIKSKTLTLYRSDEPVFGNNKITYYDGKKEKTVKLSDTYATIYNGKASFNVTKEDYNFEVGKIVLVNSDADSEYEVIYLYNGDIAYADVVDGVYKTVIDTFIRPGETRTKVFEENSSDITYNVLSNGEKISLSSINEGSVFEFYESEDGKYVEIDLLNNKINGTVTGRSDKTIYIDDVEYECTPYFRNRYMEGLPTKEPGTFVLTNDGSLAAVISGSSGESTLALITGVKPATGLESGVMVQVFTEHGLKLVHKTKDTIRINDDFQIPSQNLESYLSDGVTLVRYNVNADNEITSIWLPEEKADNQKDSIYRPGVDNANTLRPYVIEGLNPDDTVYYKIFGTFVPHFAIDANSTVFIVNLAEGVSEEDKYAIGSTESWKNDSQHAFSTLHPYNVSAAGRADVFVMKTEAVDEYIDGEKGTGGIIYDISHALDRKGEKALKISVCSNNTYHTVYLSENHKDYVKATNPNSDLYLEIGDYIMCKTDIYSNVAVIRKDFDYSKSNINDSLESTDDNRSLVYYYGELLSLENETFSIALIDSSSVTKTGNIVIMAQYMEAPSESFWILENGKKVKVSTQALSALPKYADRGYKVFIRTRYADIAELCIYAN
ncbi:MAG: hypothetical protein IKV88_01970 [Clostridia bacterium]|nr:hypothetical protein [Clostridia bacterium]